MQKKTRPARKTIQKCKRYANKTKRHTKQGEMQKKKRKQKTSQTLIDCAVEHKPY